MEPRLGIYVAGPMRGLPEWGFPAFHRVHDEWVTNDPDVFDKIYWFCPACEDEKTGFSTEGMSGTEDLTDLGFDLRRALAKDLKWIARNADVVIVLPGWESSKGALAEVALAHALGLIVTAYDDQADGFADPYLVTPDEYQATRGALQRELGEIPVEDLWADGNDYGYRATGDAAVHQSDPEPETVVDPFDTSFIKLPKAFTEHFGINAEFVADRTLKDGEVRVTSSSGGEKGKKPQRFELIPARPLWLLAELYGKGALKYEDRNWERGYPWSLSYGAANRHMNLFWQGEDYDAHKDDCPEDCNQHTGLPHLICAVFHMFGLTEFMETKNEFDDRPIR
jgi:hypothetical protein